MVGNKLLERCVDVTENLRTFADGEQDELGKMCNEAVEVIAQLLDRLGAAKVQQLIKER